MPYPSTSSPSPLDTRPDLDGDSFTSCTLRPDFNSDDFTLSLIHI